MIHQIINEGFYKFNGDLNDFKKCISSFKITKVVHIGKVMNVELCEVYGKFKYHGDTHKIHISKHWGGENLLFIKYLGGNE